MNEPTFEIFDHTADAGIRWTGRSPEDIINLAPSGLYATIGMLVPEKNVEHVELRFKGPDRARLLRDLLAEILILFETRQLMVIGINVIDFTDSSLNATLTTAVVNAAKSELYREVKAVTYHELRFEKTDDGFEAVVIVDI